MQRSSIVIVTVLALSAAWPRAQTRGVARFPLADRSLTLSRGITTNAFFDVVGRKSAAFGYEGRPMEVWVYPLKVLDNLQLSFKLEGYPLAVPASELPGAIEVRPEATIFTFSHAAYTVRQIVLSPIDEAAIVILLDIDTVLPMTVIGSFRPSLRPMWPAGGGTANANWNTELHAYELSEESGRFAARIGIPGGVDRSVMPYQEQPRDVPLEFSIEVSAEQARRELIPIVITGAIDGRASADKTYERVAGDVAGHYRRTAEHYEKLRASSAALSTPDPRLDRAFDWAIVGMDKGFAINPALGTGLVAGFRTSGNSERPGFAWFFGRDALWTSLALTASSRPADARTALEFLAKYQRHDGKIPHEISQSASLIAWFKDFPYAWASADATPLYVIAQADAWRAGGDRTFLERHWPSIVKAYRFSAATDTDGNALIENTEAGHGWVEGGALYPPHEEIYMQGLWIEASRSLAEMATELGDRATADMARAAAERTRAAMESTYWLPAKSHYAFATSAKSGIVDEDTVLPAVPMWWKTLEPGRAEMEVDRLGSGALATDWGQRILSNESGLYDPLSYHYGSVWPLFTGWASMAAYRYGRPHVGYQALMANALLTEQGALGYVTELLSGDLNAAFGRSSHHQVWSEAMVVAPLVRGLFGIEPLDGGKRLRIAPQLPADWDRASIRRVVGAGVPFDIEISRTATVLTMRVRRAATPATSAIAPSLLLSPAFALDATVDRVSIGGKPAKPTIVRSGDVQLVEVTIPAPSAEVVAEFTYRGGSDVYVRREAPATGARNEGLRILRSRAERNALRLLLEGLSGRTYELFLRTPRRATAAEGAKLEQRGDDPVLRVTFDGPSAKYARREVVVRLATARD
jgi:glycogen debranching enzyme